MRYLPVLVSGQKELFSVSRVREAPLGDDKTSHIMFVSGQSQENMGICLHHFLYVYPNRRQLVPA